MKMRMKRIRKIRDNKHFITGRIEGADFSMKKSQDDNDFVLRFVRRHILRDYSVECDAPQCSHFLIGSASVNALLRGDHNTDTYHDMFSHGENRRLGNLAEEAYEKLLDNKGSRVRFVKHPFAYHPKFPFICAVPDFVVFKKGAKPVLREVKSSIEKKSLSLGVLLSAHSTQVQVAAECLGISAAEIVPIHRSRKAPWSYQPLPRIIVPTGFEVDKKQLIERYVIFLKDYFRFVYTITIPHKVIVQISSLLHAYSGPDIIPPTSPDQLSTSNKIVTKDCVKLYRRSLWRKKFAVNTKAKVPKKARRCPKKPKSAKTRKQA